MSTAAWAMFAAASRVPGLLQRVKWDGSTVGRARRSISSLRGVGAADNVFSRRRAARGHMRAAGAEQRVFGDIHVHVPRHGRDNRAFEGARLISVSAPALAEDKQDGGSKASESSSDAAGSSDADGGDGGWLHRVFGPQNVTAPAGYANRWAMALPAFATHLCIGSPWGWSVLAGPVGREYGFVTSAADDWTFSEVAMPMSIVFTLQGLTAAFAAKYQMKYGARASMTAAGLCFGGGLVLGSIGIATHQLWLLYLGYGVLAGMGVGGAYTPPVQALIEWFPDRKGLASGLTIAGFGSGALVFAPASTWLADRFSKLPEFVGPTEAVNITSKEGRLFTEVAGELKEVVIATGSDVAKLSHDLSEGVYVVGSGSTGAAPALAVMGGLYLATMVGSAFAIKRPAPGYKPAGFEEEDTSTAQARTLVGTAPAGNVHVDQVMKTPQFYALSTVFFSVACGGMGLMSVAKPMMSEVFSSSLPLVVTSAFASNYVLALSAGNLGGRLGWGMFSDKFGRKLTFNIYTLGSIPLYLGVPYMVSAVVESGSTLPLYAFIGSSVVAISFMGGVYATLPAYEADLFGNKYVGPIHGKVLLASSLASVVGPAVLLQLRGSSERAAIENLATVVDADKFRSTFGTGVEALEELVAAKSVTISSLMNIAPSGTVDPTPFIYNSTMYTMGGFMAVAAVAHQFVRPVDRKYHEEEVLFKGGGDFIVTPESEELDFGDDDKPEEDMKLADGERRK